MFVKPPNSIALPILQIALSAKKKLSHLIGSCFEVS